MSCTGTFHDGEAGTKQCSYCGSISVADAIRFLKTSGTRFSGADQKYGFPHKFYIEPPNPDADKIVEIGSQSILEGESIDFGTGDYWTCFAHHRSDCTCPKERGVTGYWSRPILGTRKLLHFKFYNTHLSDAMSEEFAEFAALSLNIFNIYWEKDEKGIKYSHPHTDSFYGFQRAGIIGEDLNPVHEL
jgi:hypothetical protein